MAMLRGRWAVGVSALERSLSRSSSRSCACTAVKLIPRTVRQISVFFMGPTLVRPWILSSGFGFALLFGVTGDGLTQSSAIPYRPEMELEAKAGDADAQFHLGNCYFFGLGVPKKQIDGVAWYRKAAEQGHAEAQFNLGGCLYQGYGVEPDQAEAFRWWRKSAGQNFPAAQISVGDCYLHGRGAEKNEAEAVRWFQKAAEQ